MLNDIFVSKASRSTLNMKNLSKNIYHYWTWTRGNNNCKCYKQGHKDCEDDKNMPMQKVTKFAYQANTKEKKLGVIKDIMVY